MNSLTNKAKLWDDCIQQNIFNNVNKEHAPKIQSIFESTIEFFASRNENITVLNKEFIIKIKEELDKLNSFEERQKDYEQLLTKPQPTKIDFSDKLDEPIKNMDLLLEKTQNNRQELFKKIENISNVVTTPDTIHNIDWASVIKKQNDILIKILETQNTILQILKK